MKQVCVVTGATSGIGYANVELLLKENKDVIALARTDEKKKQLLDKLNPFLVDGVNLHIITGNLSSKKGVFDVFEQIKHILDNHYQSRLDILMNVAGMVSSGLHLNEDGNEMTFAVNHLSVFALTLYLIPYLNKSEDPRVLVVSSLSHYRARINFNNIQNIKCYNILKAYQRSKLYNVFFVKEFSRRYPKIAIYAIDPGLVKTEIGLKNTSKLASLIWSWRVSKGTDAYYPSRYMVKITTDKTYLGLSGEYFKEGKLKKTNPITYHKEKAAKLWEYSEKLIG